MRHIRVRICECIINKSFPQSLCWAANPPAAGNGRPLRRPRPDDRSSRKTSRPSSWRASARNRMASSPTPPNATNTMRAQTTGSPRNCARTAWCSTITVRNRKSATCPWTSTVRRDLHSVSIYCTVSVLYVVIANAVTEGFEEFIKTSHEMF